MRPRFLFASSIAAFGGEAHASDDSKLLPEVGVLLELQRYEVGQSTIDMISYSTVLIVADHSRKYILQTISFPLLVNFARECNERCFCLLL